MTWPRLCPRLPTVGPRATCSEAGKAERRGWSPSPRGRRVAKGSPGASGHFIGNNANDGRTLANAHRLGTRPRPSSREPGEKGGLSGRSTSPTRSDVPLPRDQRGSVTHPRPHSPDAGRAPGVCALIYARTLPSMQNLAPVGATSTKQGDPHAETLSQPLAQGRRPARLVPSGDLSVFVQKHPAIGPVPLLCSEEGCDPTRYTPLYG